MTCPSRPVLTSPGATVHEIRVDAECTLLLDVTRLYLGAEKTMWLAIIRSPHC